MKLALQVFLATAGGPLIGVAIIYALFAFVALDWSWALHTDGAGRGLFVLFGGFGAAFGFAGGVALAQALD